MDKIIKKVLLKIEETNHQAYLVGGYVRDYLLGIKSLDVDICTDALPKELHQIFPNNTNCNNYGGFNLKIKNYNIDITTFRKEINYNKRKPTEIIYINNLEEDIKRRDFTINAICMDKNEKIIDLVNGIEDLNKRQIKMIGDVKHKITEDPLRILRAIRFASVLDFDLDKDLYNKIKEDYKLVETLSETRIKSELTKILLHKNFKKGLMLMKELKILEVLQIDYEDINYVNDICGMWAQLKTLKSYAFTKQEITNIINIREIINEGEINNKILYKHGLYNALVAGEILNINKKDINKMYNKLPLKNIKDLQISNEEILTILKLKPSKILKEIKNNLTDLILEGKLKNEHEKIIDYILKNYT